MDQPHRVSLRLRESLQRERRRSGRGRLNRIAGVSRRRPRSAPPRSPAARNQTQMALLSFTPSVNHARFSTLVYPTVTPVTKTLTTAGGVITLTTDELLGGLLRVDCQD